jgi:transposase
MATTEVFMSNRQYTDEFKAEAVKQVTERGFRVVTFPRKTATGQN